MKSLKRIDKRTPLEGSMQIPITIGRKKKESKFPISQR